MSIKLMSLVWDSALPPSDKMVMLALADFANDDGVCWPAIGTLARKCSKSERTIQRSISALCEAGLLERRQRGQTSAIYKIKPDKMTGRQNDGVTKTTSQPDTMSPKPLRTTISTTAVSARVKFACPDGVTEQAWKDFKATRKPSLNETAYRRLCHKLESLVAQGYDPNELIELAADNGWRSVFPPKENRNGKSTNDDRPVIAKAGDVVDEYYARQGNSTPH